jgi:hypothetical protein
MKAQYYDLNVYGPSDNELSLTAYEWELSSDGDIQMNSSKFHTIAFTYLKDIKEIEFLLGDLAVNHHPFTDYDEWRDLEDVYNIDTPKVIRYWLENLPMYDVPVVGVING